MSIITQRQSQSMIEQSNSCNENVFLAQSFSCLRITDKNEAIPFKDRNHLLSKSRFMRSFIPDVVLGQCP